MKKWWISVLLVSGSMAAWAQQAADIIKSAREYSMAGDVENTIVVLKKGMEQFPGNTDIALDLAMAYMTAKRNAQALEVLKPLMDNNKAEETVYQVAGLVYRSELDYKEADKVYKAGLKAYPKSGMLHNEYGQLMEAMEPGRGSGIKLWEKGIELDPGYANNYYHAARYYAAANNSVWTMLYGEIFVNLDSYSSRTIEIKNLLFQFYKRVFAFGVGGLNDKNPFEKAVAETLLKQKGLASSGINPESLSAIRTRFILDWFYNPLSQKYPFRLFERQQNMLRDGLFDAYNQWLFGGAANLAAFQNWTKTNNEAYQDFTRFQRQKLFVMNNGQYYRQ